jgi:hypothetical protein
LIVQLLVTPGLHYVIAGLTRNLSQDKEGKDAGLDPA